MTSWCAQLASFYTNHLVSELKHYTLLSSDDKALLLQCSSTPPLFSHEPWLHNSSEITEPRGTSSYTDCLFQLCQCPVQCVIFEFWFRLQERFVLYSQ